jgi:hypothetical protein
LAFLQQPPQHSVWDDAVCVDLIFADLAFWLAASTMLALPSKANAAAMRVNFFIVFVSPPSGSKEFSERHFTA